MIRLFGVSVRFQAHKQMSALERKRAWNRDLAKKAAATAVAKSTVAPISSEGPKLRSYCGVDSTELSNRQTTLEKRCFEPSISELYNFEHPSFDKDVSFSFKVSNARYIKKGELIVSSMKRNYSDTDLKPPVRSPLDLIIVRSRSSSEMLGKSVLETTKTTLVSNGSNSAQSSFSEKHLNTSGCILKSELRNSCSWNPKKRKVEGNVEPPTKLEKKVDSKKKVLAKTISAIPSLVVNEGAARNRNKCFPGAICSSRLSAALNRNSEWEKLALKSRSIFLKHRSQKMLKDRLEKYCVIKQKSHMYYEGKSDAKEASQTPETHYLTNRGEFNQDFFCLFSSDLNKNKVKQSEILCGSNESETSVEKNMPSRRILNHGISKLDMQGFRKIPFSSVIKSVPLTAIDGNSSKVMNVKGLSLISHTKEATEIEVTKEVESLVEKALLQTAASSYFRTNQVLRKCVSGNVQEGCDFHMTNNNAKLRKMWALVAEESSLTDSLNDINTKISKIKANLCTLSNESFQITKRLDEVRFLKNQLLSDSQCKFHPNFQL
ncbi:unnamed protein product [Brugia pahangi]|uniref:Non-specific serine/threonine protein kinase n=1 Tax=Brugia pahangi TaxID=6280 RepID=A0A0N4TN50_BRUPA|nr:unnamed protein product [Brugia pahangi]